MEYPKQPQLFTIKEFARACGVSRTSLINMEESGYLTPYRIDPNTGYRYYDAFNASQVGQYQLLQTLGLNRAEIADYYHHRMDTEHFLITQRKRLSRMQRVLEELELRHDSARSLRFSFLDLSELVCFCETAKISTAEEGEVFHYRVYTQCIKEGFQLLGTEPLFSLSADDWRTPAAALSSPREITSCIPVVPPAHSDPRLMTFPAARAFSMLAYGDYTVIFGLYERFWQEADARGVRPAGPARFIGLVAPYVNRKIAQQDFVYRMVVPVETV